MTTGQAGATVPDITNLEHAITYVYEALREARFDGDQKTIDVLEMRLDYL